MREHKTAVDYLIYTLLALVLVVGVLGLWDTFSPLRTGEYVSLIPPGLGRHLVVNFTDPWANLDRVTVLLVGADERRNDKGRSDTLMVVFANPRTKQVAALSIPRDMKADIPGHGRDKINHAFNWGGVQLSKQTVEENLGLNLDHYVKVNFDGFKEIVDALGGVDLTVEKRMKYKDWWGQLYIDLQPGYQHLTGEQAMGYVRYRTDSDYDRMKRQQKFLAAMVEQKLHSRNALNLLRILPALQRAVETSLTPSEMVALAELLEKTDPAMVLGAQVPVHNAPTSHGFYSELEPEPYHLLIQEINEHLDSGPPQPTTVEVLNTTKTAGLAADCAKRLEAKGFQVVTGNSGAARKFSTVLYKPGQSRTARWVTRIIGCGQAVRDQDPGGAFAQGAPLRVVLGRDYLPATTLTAAPETSAKAPRRNSRQVTSPRDSRWRS